MSVDCEALDYIRVFFGSVNVSTVSYKPFELHSLCEFLVHFSIAFIAITGENIDYFFQFRRNLTPLTQHYNQKEN